MSFRGNHTVKGGYKIWDYELSTRIITRAGDKKGKSGFVDKKSPERANEQRNVWTAAGSRSQSRSSGEATPPLVQPRLPWFSHSETKTREPAQREVNEPRRGKAGKHLLTS